MIFSAVAKLPGAVRNPMTDQAMLTEMARSLAIIERYWATHFRTGDEIDALTIHQARTILTDATLDPTN